jgi:hypothetical protein
MKTPLRLVVSLFVFGSFAACMPEAPPEIKTNPTTPAPSNPVPPQNPLPQDPVVPPPVNVNAVPLTCNDTMRNQLLLATTPISPVGAPCGAINGPANHYTFQSAVAIGAQVEVDDTNLANAYVMVPGANGLGTCIGQGPQVDIPTVTPNTQYMIVVTTNTPATGDQYDVRVDCND